MKLQARSKSFHFLTIAVPLVIPVRVQEEKMSVNRCVPRSRWSGETIIALQVPVPRKNNKKDNTTVEASKHHPQRTQARTKRLTYLYKQP